MVINNALSLAAKRGPDIPMCECEGKPIWLATVYVTNLLDFQPKHLRGIPSRCRIADEFEDDLVDDRVPKGQKTAERSSVFARKTTWQVRYDHDSCGCVPPLLLYLEGIATNYTEQSLF